MNEIDSLTTQLNSALRGMCSAGDIGSDGTLMILEQKLKGYICTSIYLNCKWFNIYTDLKMNYISKNN